MNLIIKFVLLSMMVIPLIAVSGTYSYFNDVETSMENIFCAGTWYKEADCLIVDTTHTDLTSQGHGGSPQVDLHNTWIVNNCTDNITLSAIRLSWNSNNVPLIKIVIKGYTYWEGEAYSGNALPGEFVPDMFLISSPDFEDYVLESKMPKEHITFWFNDTVEREDFKFVYTMSDGSEKYVHWPDGQKFW